MINVKSITTSLTNTKFKRYSLIAIGSIALGVGAGFAGARILKPTVTEVVMNENNSLAVTEGYLKLARTAYDTAVKNGDSLETALTPDQMMNLAYDMLGNLESTKAIGIGVSNAMNITSQEIQSCAIKNGDEYFEESNSLGIVSIHNRMYQSGDTTTTYWGEKDDYENHPKKEMTNEEYSSMMGRKISEGLVYVVLPSTIAKENVNTPGYENAPTGIYKENNGYRIEIEMDVKATSSGSSYMPGVYRYQKQMKNISNLSSYPNFTYCHLTALVDKDLKLISMKNVESYTATMASVPFPATCKAELITYYFTDQEYKIPDLTEKIDYSITK